MKNTWASGALELLQHADTHIEEKSAFDSRIAFISIDNSVETSVRTYLSLPPKISGIKITRKNIDEAGNSFPQMVELLFDNASSKLVGLDSSDIEHYHRIRNQLYHNGTGLGVDERYLFAYRQIASVLLNNLFGVEVSPSTKEPTLENLILLYNDVKSLLNERFIEKGVDTGHTYKWEMAKKEGILTIDDIQALTELGMIRNSQVHSSGNELNKQRIKHGVKLALMLLEKLKG